ncbi:hypothetical protein WR25_06905 [Diploscapter pachys]|uniref:Lipid-binding serum glycoprotein C-terminal domain-containing protein n=1 Tax=Diploscapter pachys TaxID=2018661 RepID=A0A2A2L442_9BILA|nr:hypothetical protein WR25_06905 [Diploscapter pachys]
MQVDGLSFNISAPITNEVKFTLSSSRLLSFDEANFQSRMVIIPTKGLSWTGSNLNVTALAAFRMHTPQGDINGNVPLSFDRTNVELLLWTGINQDGHLKTDLITCKVAANNMQLRFAPGDASLLANYLPHIHNLVRQTIEQVVCPSFHAELVPVISNRVMNTPLSAALFDQYFINYALLGGVDFREDAVYLRHRGNSFGILRQGRTRLNDFRLPFRSPPLDVSPNLTASEHMLDFYLSNYTMASLLFWMDQYKTFDYEISRTAQNNTQLQGYLKTECAAGDICAGTLFPALGARFPNGEVVIKSHTITYPKMTIKKNNATIYIDSRVDAFVQQGDRVRRFLTASMNADVKLEKVRFTNYVLHADMHIEKFKISEVASLVDGIDEGSLEFLVNALTELILNEDMSKKLKGGIHLPIIFDYDQHSSEVMFEEGRIRISTDFCFGEKCKAPIPISEQKDNNADYYDSVG